MRVLVGTGHARGPEPFDVVTDIVGESIVAGFLLPLTGFLCWPAAGKRRVKKPRAFPVRRISIRTGRFQPVAIDTCRLLR
ncbi:hypothetical protein [Actinoplanes subglobosus]|uniref:Uncharacterized protein n=1 Tax=Actinoplanes subglobosus TaxID=1547892 RepID=A0ABV8J5B3_9ACTN